MPGPFLEQSAEELRHNAATLERRLRALKRNIKGVSDIPKDPLEGPVLSLFRARLSTAQADWAKFESAWAEREEIAIIQGASDNFPSDQLQSFYDECREELIRAEAILHLAQKDQPTASTQDVTAQDVTLNATIGGHARAQLPKISIPTFSGDILQWRHFKDTFSSLVHREPTLTDIERFHYLLSALKGEAAALLSRFPVEEDNYKQAWEKLCSTYDNPRVLATLLVNRITDCEVKSIKSELPRYEAFLANVADSIEAFRGLKMDDPCDFLLSTLALRSLDNETRRQFELYRSSYKTCPTTDDVIEFVRQRMNAVRLSRDHPTSSSSMSTSFSADQKRGSNYYPNRSSRTYKGASLHTASSSSGRNSASSASSTGAPFTRKGPQKCLLCNESHFITKCEEFGKLDAKKRFELVSKWKRCCRNCLRQGHTAYQCQSKYRCRICKRKHNSLIHTEPANGGAEKSVDAAAKGEAAGPLTHVGFTGPPPYRNTVLLGTVQALITAHDGHKVPIRALLDSGSHHSFITTSMAETLKLDITKFGGSISGLGQAVLPGSLIKGSATCTIGPYASHQRINTTAVVVDRITGKLPTCSIPNSVSNEILNKSLADHDFHRPGPIDMLLGGDVYPHIVTGAPRHSGIEDLFLLPTVFGMVVIGSLTGDQQSTATELSCALYVRESEEKIASQLEAFWRIEEPPGVDRTSPDDIRCEEHFLQTHYRNEEGRYVVRLPFNSDPQNLGANRNLALRRFYTLETKFRKEPELADKYRAFMREYQDLKHMTPTSSQQPYVIPHHGVWQGSYSCKKLRVVFDASCRSTHCSLNDLLHAGPKLQSDLSDIIIRFRLYAVPLCADLVKMYRQILIHPDDRQFQHILWRDTQSEELKEMELNTVTYGIKSSSFQAIRVIKQLIRDEGAAYPLAMNRADNDMYVDDIVTGAQTIQEALQLQTELRELFQKGGFSLGKWASTHQELLSASDASVESVPLNSPDDDRIKVLGLAWNCKDDSFSFTVGLLPTRQVTKRIMLSTVARIFDPLGFLAPLIFLAKTLIQDVWAAKLGWDDELTDGMLEKWKGLVENWDILPSIRIPRHISSPDSQHALIGFCDASTKGYAAAVYLRSEDKDGEARVSLIKAKSKVAPLTYTSVARLELCGALLLSRLVSSISPSLKSKLICFCDSTIVLAWLNTPIHALAVYEANRVSQIVASIPPHHWRHVRSEENPADLASRGCNPQDIRDNRLWWSGPSWLASEFPSDWNITFRPPMDSTTIAMSGTSQRITRDTPAEDDWTTRFSSYRLLVRLVARLLHLLNRVRTKPKSQPGPITAKDLEEAERRLIKYVQGLYLPKDMTKGSSNGASRAYAQLSPFQDERGIVRVGGRLQEAPLGQTSKHPYILPYQSHLARLVIDEVHKQNFHAGPTLTLSLLRNKYWIPRAAKVIRGRILRCVHCRISRAKSINPRMAPLPKDRFSQVRAFEHTGVDYAGPFLIKESRRRNASLGKAYLCLFICMSCKALHLELVSSLTTTAFLAALERFIARRGTPSVIWSDHGTNFIGASRFLKDVYKFQQQAQSTYVDKLSSKGVEWKFIPPRAPHFGGLWEAGVKSVKGLLANAIGKTPHTFEELSTALTKIESILNSRPLCKLSESDDCYEFLTPGHFLVGSSMSILPEPSDIAQTHPDSSRWQALQAAIAHIWTRWRKEYLHTLQQRTKWTRQTSNLKPGDLVIMLEKRSLVGHWPVARVLNTFPGRDGTVRSVLVRTPSGATFTRAVSSLAPLFYPEPEGSPGNK